MIIDTWDSRISDVANACNIFIQESNYNINYSDINTTMTLWNMFNDTDTGIIVDYNNQELNGFAIVQRTNDFHEEYFGYLSKFYILPDKRTTRASFRLMDEITEWFDMRDCVVSFATATAGIGADNTFIKLLSRFGYEHNPTGMLIRKQYGKI